MNDRLLRNLPLFATLNAAERRALGNCGQRRLVKEGGELFERGRLRDSLIVVLKGRIRIFQMFNGRYETLALLETGSFIGEQALINPTQLHEQSAVADIASEVWTVPGNEFLRLQRQQPHLAVKVLSAVLNVISDRLTHADTKLLTLYTTGKIATLATDLQELAALVLRTLVRTVRARQGLFIVFKPAENHAIIREALGYRKNLSGRTIALERDPIFGRLCRNDERIVVTREQYSRDKHWRTIYSSPGFLTVPVSIGRDVIGAIYVGDKRNGENFSVNNRILLAIVANQIAVAIQDARTEEERRAKEELERVYIKPL